MTQDQKNTLDAFERIGKDIKRIDANGPVNVKHPKFGAVGDGVTDDTAAIQAAINYAKATAIPGLFSVIFFPRGRYKVSTALNGTNSSGLRFVGEGSRYSNSVIVGFTPNVIVDFSGSTLSGMSNMGLLAQNGQGVMSTIGVLFGLTRDINGNSVGGLNCSLDNVCIEMPNLLPSVNNGLGSIPVLNVRSEEFGLHNIYLQGNTPAIFSNSINLGTYTGFNFNVSSPHATLQNDGNGSMGVIKFSGQATLKQYEKYSPALLLNGTNSVDFDGYIARNYVTPGRTDTYDTAIKVCQATYGLRIAGTNEVHSTLLDVRHGVENASVMVNVANQFDPSKPIINIAGGFKGLKLNIAIPNPSERSGRELLHADPVDLGDTATNAYVHNSEIICSTFPDNKLAVSPNLLRNLINTKVATGQPFEVVGNTVIQRFPNPVTAGVLGNIQTANVIRYSAADRNTRTSGNAGSYKVRTTGVITCGLATSNAFAILEFEAIITYVQNLDRSLRKSKIDVNVKSMITTDSAAINLTAPTVTFDTTDPNLYRILVTPAASGSNVGEVITVDTITEIKSNFAVNSAVMFA